MRWAKASGTVCRQLRRQAVAALVAGSVAVAGCGSTHGPASQSYPGDRVTGSGPKAAPPPPLCDLARLRVRLAAAVSSAEASGQTLSLHNATGRACVMPTYWPSVRLGLGSSGHGPVGKALPLPAEFLSRALRAFLAPYRHSETFTLRPGDIASLAILWLLRANCHSYASVVLYPSALAAGPGYVSQLPRPITVCGTPYLLPYLSGDLGATALRATVQALAKRQSRIPVGPGPSPAASGHQLTSHVATCRTFQLKINMPWSGAAGGTVAGRIGFTNLGSRPCRMRGWPTVVAVQAGGKPSAAVDRLTMMFGPIIKAPPRVILKPQMTAEAVFTGSDGPGLGEMRCPPPYRRLRVTPPGNSKPVTIPAWIPWYRRYMPSCSGIWVSAVVPYSALYQP
jgi:uncharacterized protein DUF4232